MFQTHVLLFLLLAFIRRRRVNLRLDTLRDDYRGRRERFRRFQAMEKSIFVLMLIVTAFNDLDTSKRRCWARPRSSHWWEHIINEEFTEDEWLQNFRMSKGTFMMLCNELRPYISKKRHQIEEMCSN